MIMQTPFTLYRDGLAIRGYLLRPEGERLPGAVVSHGLLSSSSTTEGYARYLASHGYLTAVFDFVGGALNGMSDGTLPDMTISSEIEDLHLVTDYLRAQREWDGRPLTLLGCSQGGFVSAFLAAREPELCDHLLLLYPGFCIPDCARSGDCMIFRFDPQNVPDLIHSRHHALSGRYIREMQPVDPFAVITGYRGRVLILHGTEDELVPPRYSLAAADAYNNAGASCTLCLIDGAQHGFDEAADAAAYGHIARFLHLS